MSAGCDARAGEDGAAAKDAGQLEAPACAGPLGRITAEHEGARFGSTALTADEKREVDAASRRSSAAELTSWEARA